MRDRHERRRNLKGKCPGETQGETKPYGVDGLYHLWRMTSASGRGSPPGGRLRATADRATQRGDPQRIVTGERHGDTAEGSTMGADGETTPRQNTEQEKISSHKGSIAIDESTVEEIRRLRSYTIATVTKGYAGSTPSRRVKEENYICARRTGLRFGASEPLMVIASLYWHPSIGLARKLENLGELKFKTFSIRCHPCTAAANSTGTAEGELRWLNIKGLPVFGRRMDMIARMLKPVGDLVYLAKVDGQYVGHCRAAVRVRRCKKLPATLYYSALTYEFTVRVELGRGEPPLPWDLAPEKTAAPGGVWGDGPGSSARAGKNPVGPVVNVREATDKTYEKQGYSEPEEQGIRRDAATTVHTKSGGSGAARIPRHGGLAGVDGESTDGWDNEDRVNERRIETRGKQNNSLRTP
ncbi:hypothetical protein J5N97_023792 [Dioscorea zingiberensis]|uniref:Uncharacterized protein n=1 Tax=Dioscorea zingiberensis TaxID=325984 RepID=A0A9D5C5H3_9LILI|nr:hypothetical protein J5N97_023792 [Dioscorea zingiberensis]